MMKNAVPTKAAAKQVMKDIRRATRKLHSSEEKIRFVCPTTAQSLYHSWSKEFLQVGKKRLAGETVRKANTGEVKDRRAEAMALKELVADLSLENRRLKKHDRGWGRPRVRHPAAEKLEIIRLVEQSHLSVRRPLAKIGIPPTTFYRCYVRFVEHGPAGLEDHPSRVSRVWKRIPEAVRDQIVTLALEKPELSPRELAVRFTDTEQYFVSEASVYESVRSSVYD